MAFIAGVADSSGYGWAIAKQLANAGATIVVGTWPPVLSLFERGIKKGFGEDGQLLDGTAMKIDKVPPSPQRHRPCSPALASLPCTPFHPHEKNPTRLLRSPVGGFAWSHAGLWENRPVGFALLLTFLHGQVYPLDAMFSTPDEVPEDIKA